MTAPPPGQWGPGAQPPVPPQQPPPGYYAQPGPWSGPPPPPNQNNTVKWMLGGVGILLIIAITVGVTVLVTRDDTKGDDGPTTTPTGEPIASADDDGPIEIITLEPTCQAWMPARDAMSRVLNSGWGDRDPSVPRSDWSAQQLADYESAARTFTDTAELAVDFARMTPHRVIRELYEQFIYYSRTYAGRVPDYRPEDNALAQAAISATYALESVCDSIADGTAAGRSKSVEPIDPSGSQLPSDPANPSPVVSVPSPTCTKVVDLQKRFVDDTAEWTNRDPNIPALELSPELKTLSVRAAEVISTFADNLEQVGHEVSDATFQDLTSFGAIYLRAYSEALPTYQPGDTFLFIAGTRANNLVVSACNSVTG